MKTFHRWKGRICVFLDVFHNCNTHFKNERVAQYLRLPRIVPNFEILKKKMKKDAIETYANVVPMQKPAEIRCFLKSQHKKTSQFILCTASERRRSK